MSQIMYLLIPFNIEAKIKSKFAHYAEKYRMFMVKIYVSIIGSDRMEDVPPSL